MGSSIPNKERVQAAVQEAMRRIDPIALENARQVLEQAAHEAHAVAGEYGGLADAYRTERIDLPSQPVPSSVVELPIKQPHDPIRQKQLELAEKDAGVQARIADGQARIVDVQLQIVEGLQELAGAVADDSVQAGNDNRLARLLGWGTLVAAISVPLGIEWLNRPTVTTTNGNPPSPVRAETIRPESLSYSCRHRTKPYEHRLFLPTLRRRQPCPSWTPPEAPSNRP